VVVIGLRERSPEKEGRSQNGRSGDATLARQRALFSLKRRSFDGASQPRHVSKDLMSAFVAATIHTTTFGLWKERREVENQIAPLNETSRGDASGDVRSSAVERRLPLPGGNVSVVLVPLVLFELRVGLDERSAKRFAKRLVRASARKASRRFDGRRRTSSGPGSVYMLLSRRRPGSRC